MYTKLQIDMLQADAITAMENGTITLKQFDCRIKRIKKLRDDLKEKEQEFISEMDEQEKQLQQDMSRGGL